jgi:hypothetical protein
MTRFNESLKIDEQLGIDINDEVTNTLTVQSYGVGAIALRVTGVSEFRQLNGESDILTIMSGDECGRFIKLLLDVRKVAKGEAVL